MVRRFQDLESWQLCDELRRRVFALIDQSGVKIDFSFLDDIRDAASSGPNNLAEGFGRFKHRDFARFARIAKGSVLEIQNHLHDGCDRGYWSAKQRDELLHLADRAAGATTRLIKYLTDTDTPGD